MSEELIDEAGRRIRLLKPLGKGGFGSVWLAEVHATSGLVHHMAVKLLHEELMRDAELVARARDEARLMSQLNHDHVVKVHALTQLSGRAAVLMEYVEGIDCTALLADCRKRGEPGLPLTIAVAVAERAASALHAAWTTHSPQTGRPLHVVHRDIKPSNLLVSVSGAVKVMDFGVARAEFDREASTQSVQYGTQRYMAPERWLESRAGPESDVFSLGVTLWELLSGTRFERLPLNPSHFDKAVAKQLQDLEKFTPNDPRALRVLQDLLSRMLAFDSDARPSAAEVEELAGSLLEGTRGPDLRRWSRSRVPALVEARADALVGDAELAALSGTMSQRVTPEETEATPRRVEPTWSPEGTSEPPTEVSRAPIFAGMAIALLLVFGVGGVAAWQLLGAEPSDVEEALVEDAVPIEEVVVAEPEPVEDAPVEEPEAARVTTPGSKTRSTAPQPVVEEPVELEEPAVAAPAITVVERPEEALQFALIKITADPRDGTATRDGVSIPTFQDVEYVVGSTVSLEFTWPDAQSVTCVKQITSDLTKIRFDKAKRACTYS